jgi:L-fuconolactonase
MSDQVAESIIDPSLPIVDPHHHLWLVPQAMATAARASNSPYRLVMSDKSRYLLEDCLADINTGHNIRATVCVEARAMYRAHGPEAMQSLGEIEFLTGAAAMAGSGLFGDVKVGAGIVGNVDLRLGDAVEDVLQAHIRAGGGRYRGIRQPVAYHPAPAFHAYGAQPIPHILLDEQFRTGFKWLRRLGLSFDVWPLETQLPEVIGLAQAFPDTQIVLDHLGTPLGVFEYQHKRAERFSGWQEDIRALARCPNVSVKLGGLGMPVLGFDSFTAQPRATSEQLAAEWSPYVQACIEAFGVDRCMFESNFPPDFSTCSYAVLWNAFKRLTAGASSAEKAALFAGTAVRLYKLAI